MILLQAQCTRSLDVVSSKCSSCLDIAGLSGAATLLDLGDQVAGSIALINSMFSLLDRDGNGWLELADLHKMQHDLGELGLTILEKAYGRFDQDRRGALNRNQFVQVCHGMPVMHFLFKSIL